MDGFHIVSYLPTIMTTFREVKSKVKLSLRLTKHQAIKRYWGSEGIASLVLKLGSRWSWVVSFTIRPLYLRNKDALYTLDMKLGGGLLTGSHTSFTGEQLVKLKW